jgi:hypothetical protein
MSRRWVTEIRAIDPDDGQIKMWHGPIVYGENEKEARQYCDTHLLGYCEIVGLFICTINRSKSEKITLFYRGRDN